MRHKFWLQRLAACLVACLAALPAPANSAGLCADAQDTEQLPTDLALCRRLDPIVRKPSALPLNQYETALNTYVSAMCHRDFAAGWQMDKTVRDTGSFIATLGNGSWSGSYNGTHAPVLIWYSPQMLAWLRANRPSDPTKTPAQPAPIPDGAMMVKEMYSPPPASTCRIPDLLKLRPDTQGMAIMVRDTAAARDGWFWAAVGWAGYTPDWPPPASNAPALSGFGQVLHQLPWLGPRQPDLRQPVQHPGRARHLPAFPQRGLFSAAIGPDCYPILADPAARTAATGGACRRVPLGCDGDCDCDTGLPAVVAAARGRASRTAGEPGHAVAILRPYLDSR